MPDEPLIHPLAAIRWLDVPSIGERSIFQMFSPETVKDQDWQLAMREGLKDKEAPVKSLTAPCNGVLDRLDLPMAQRTLICRPPIRVEDDERPVDADRLRLDVEAVADLDIRADIGRAVGL